MKKKVWTAVVAVLAVLILASIALSGNVDMKEGNWESTMEVTMEGMPIQMPPMKFTATQCLTKEDMVPKSAQKDENCKVVEQKITGSKVSWKVQCIEKGGTTTEGVGNITYSGTSYTGTMKTKTTDKNGQSFTSTTKMKGRRIGDCTK